MRVKKTKKTPAAARAAKKPLRSIRSRSAAPASSPSGPSHDEKLAPAIGTGPVIAAIACIVMFVGAIALVPSRGTPRQPEAAAADASAETPAPQKPRTKPEPPRVDVKPDARKKTPVEPVTTAPVEPVGALVADAAPTVATPSATTPEPIKARPIENVASSVTITGCLEHEDTTFWLSDTSGADAPTARSWKSGFLKKRPSRIELVDPNNALKLPAYVGRRIAATGTLMNREMQPRSLHPLGMSCS